MEKKKKDKDVGKMVLIYKNFSDLAARDTQGAHCRPCECCNHSPWWGILGDTLLLSSPFVWQFAFPHCFTRLPTKVGTY